MILVDFIRGIKILIRGGRGEVKGDKKLARVALIVKGQIPAYGADTVRKQLINSIEGDIKRASKKKDPKAEVEKLINNAVSTPSYMDLLKALNMDERHLRYMAREVIPYGK